MRARSGSGRPRVSVSVVTEPTSAWRRAVQRLRSVGSHVGLLLLLVVYTAGGAKIFQDIELPSETAEFDRVYNHVMARRHHLVWKIVNNTDVINLDRLVGSLLQEYETELLRAVRSGVDVTPGQPVHKYKWTYIHSVFFSSTVLTTIGYGNMAPRTTPGRLFCMLFALIGIPLTLSVIADLGALFATSVSTLYARLAKRAQATATATATGGDSRSVAQLTERQERALTLLVALGSLVLYIAVGGGLFLLLEDWPFFESFYFCFVTMTTIGFGDFVPENSEYMLVCTLYILVGLALTTTIIEIVRRQYAQSWRQMKMLTSRIQSLSGPLAEHLKKLGEHGHGVTVDGDLVRELKELRKTMASARIRDGLGWDDAELDALRPPPPVVQIVIYESNV
ncbi:TWiK family of potassium channels protein 7-like [Amphibalanus amphitrite]|uniref:TWiK family of potassium channels protein 7-like n=1 Tax=Amphibalanus amphitrite TaxID=1232801 RepID=UPI001C904B38|nr:TWiK family of potassium channels protein 7-like [Amphibalanus amphitrite]